MSTIALWIIAACLLPFGILGWWGLADVVREVLKRRRPLKRTANSGYPDWWWERFGGR